MQETKLLEILTTHNRFWKTGSIDSGVKRDLLPACLKQLESPEVVVLKGVRRSGKSTLLAQIISHLLEQGVQPTSILRVNLEEPLFAAEYSIELLEQIYRTYRERIQPEGKCWLFLDEIQNIPGWESWVRGRSETEEIKTFISGSSTQMLSREIGTKLTGRQVSFEVYPLTFNEFLSFNDLHIKSELDYLHHKTLIRHLFLQYMDYGGFPEIVLRTDNEDKKLLLKNYFEDILYRDVATRHEVRDTANLRNLAVYLLTNIARLTSINKLRKNFAISQDKTENYVSALLESYLIAKLQKFSYSLKSSLRSGFKIFSIDTGLRNRVAFSFSRDFGHLAENIIYFHLKQKHDEVYFMANGNEIDFALKQGMYTNKLIQVWYNEPGNNRIPERELAYFTENPNANKQAEKILITNDYEDEIKLKEGNIKCIPITKYLLYKI